MEHYRAKGNIFVYVVCAIAALTGFLFGFDTGIISGAILFIKRQFALTTGQQELVIGSVLMGAVVGAVVAGRLADYFGRRMLLIIAAVVFIAGTLCSAYAYHASILIIGRLLLGFAIGITSSVAPVYLSELSPYGIRGTLIALYQLAITLGIFISYLVGYYFSKSGNWHWMLGSGIIPALILFVGMLFLPKSPRWMMTKGKREQARKVLQKLRKTKAVDDELQDIAATIAIEGQANWRLLFSRWARPALVVAVGLAILSQLVGINTIIYYAPTVFAGIGFNGSVGSTAATMIIGLVNFVATIVGICFIDKIGRRPLVILGLFLMIIGHFSLAWTFHNYQETVDNQLRWVALAGTVIFIIGFAVSLGIISWVLNAEVFPLRIRGLGSGVAATSNWLFNALVSSTFLTLVNKVGADGAFFIYGVICMLGLLLVFVWMPETKGISLEQLEYDLHQGVNVRYLGQQMQ